MINEVQLKFGAKIQEAMAQLDVKEKVLLEIIMQVGINSKSDAWSTGDKQLFTRNLKSVIKRTEMTGWDFVYRPTWKDTRKVIKKLERLGLMKIDEDGVPQWLYRDRKEIMKTIEGLA